MKLFTLISIVDKPYDTNHSFVKIFLKNNKYYNNLILAEKNFKNSNNRPVNNNFRYIFPILRKRKFLNRLHNFFKIISFLNNYKSKNPNRLNVLVRNDPLSLLACSLILNRNDSLIYHSSFPHENFNYFKGIIQKLIFFLLRKKNISLLAVSNLGLKRLKKYFPNSKNFFVNPLLSSMIKKKVKNKKNFFYFTYIGSHDKIREIDFVIKSFIFFLKKNQNNKNINTASIKFLFIGSNLHQCNKLKEMCKQFKNNFKFIPKVSMRKINDYLNISHIGVSIIPPKDFFLESCPTKVIEYLSCGLPILANYEIPFHKNILLRKVGYGVSWNTLAIVKMIENILRDKHYAEKSYKAYKYYKKNFNSSFIQKQFAKIILEG